MNVPWLWVLSVYVAFAETLTSCSTQLLSKEPTFDFHIENPEVATDYSEHSGDKCTQFLVSWVRTSMMNLSSEQKQVIKGLYKNIA